jgi:hypothetical protein
MRWDARIPRPFWLVDGRKVSTLSDARLLMLELPERNLLNAHWQRAGEWLRKAAALGEKQAIMEARAHLSRALRAEGLTSPMSRAG